MTERGSVSSRLEAVLSLRLRGPAGAVVELPAIVDTGYTGSLSLPQRVVSQLQLPLRAGSRAVPADGSERLFEMFAVEVFWDGEWVGVVGSALGSEALVGMSLLAGRVLLVEVSPGGVVEVRGASALGRQDDASR